MHKMQICMKQTATSTSTSTSLTRQAVLTGHSNHHEDIKAAIPKIIHIHPSSTPVITEGSSQTHRQSKEISPENDVNSQNLEASDCSNNVARTINSEQCDSIRLVSKTM